MVSAGDASPAPAAVTIGQLAPEGTPSQCNFVTDRLQPEVLSGNSYVVPSLGVPALRITSWSYNATGANPGQQMMTMKVFRKVGDPRVYQAVGHDGPRPIAPGSLNTFSTDVPVQPGDVLGTNLPVSVNTACIFTSPAGDLHLFNPAGGSLSDGDSAAFIQYTAPPGWRVNVAAVVSPANSFTVGAISRNKKRGTATVTLTVPNPGELSGAGTGVSASSAAVSSKAVGAGQAQLLIRAKGKKKRKLNAKGKVKLAVTLTYTPTGGAPSTQSLTVKLKKKRKR